ncbi:MAG: hypothetical protein U0X20_03250 [Caldilineaceae bacterium]
MTTVGLDTGVLEQLAAGCRECIGQDGADAQADIFVEIAPAAACLIAAWQWT